MESRYDAGAAERLVRDLAGQADELLALRTYTARLIGADAALVVHGGGNTSVKATAKNAVGDDVEVLHVKGSGWDLATIEPAGHPAVRLAPLRELRRLPALSDEAMVNELRTNLLDAQAPNPSVETLLHALLPARFIDHTHADAILALANQPDGKRIFASLFGPGLVWIPYVMPGFALAKRCAEIYEEVAASGAAPRVMVLEKHGLFTWGDTARESYERTIDAVTRAERYAEAHRRPHAAAGSFEAARFDAARIEMARDVALNSSEVLPRLRGAIAKLAGDAPERGPIVRARTTPALLGFMARFDAAELVNRGCMTPDHALRTKPTALFVPGPLAASDLGDRLEAALADYARKYDAYFEENCRAKNVTRKKLDACPRVILLPGFGMCSAAATARDADAALDVYEHTAGVMMAAADVGTYAPCSRADVFDVEYWSLEQAKIKPVVGQPLSRAIAFVSGAASGIGRATAQRLLAAGAHVAMADRDEARLDEAAAPLHKVAPGRVLAMVLDVRDTDAVLSSIRRVVEAWGGLDVVVSNAGTAPQGQLDTAEGDAKLRESLDINLLSHAAVARAAVAVFALQGRGGALLFNASKSAFNPGPGFGPYAVAKSALVALMRQYAVDLGSQGVRSNAVNADRVRTQLFGGGVLEARAAARGVTVDEYFRANLLSREVTADDVADAFAYLASARATTGCVITVDGGQAPAFPR